MSDRWDEDEEEELGRRRGRPRERELEPEREPTVGELIEGSVRKLVTGMVIAGALIGLGVYGSGRNSGGGGSDLEYQIVTSADGQIVYRINTDSGSIVACRPTSNHCWLMQRGNRDLDDEPPAENVAAPPQQPQAITTQPAGPQLPAPQNTQAPAPATR
jgi:hypothetical protein